MSPVFCLTHFPWIVQSNDFINKVNSCMLGVKQCDSSEYHPQINGLDEILNQTLVTTVKKVVDVYKDN